MLDTLTASTKLTEKVNSQSQLWVQRQFSNLSCSNTTHHLNNKMLVIFFVAYWIRFMKSWKKFMFLSITRRLPTQIWRVKMIGARSKALNQLQFNKIKNIFSSQVWSETSWVEVSERNSILKGPRMFQQHTNHFSCWIWRFQSLQWIFKTALNRTSLTNTLMITCRMGGKSELGTNSWLKSFPTCCVSIWNVLFTQTD